ncbi:MAG: PPC domain-containing protein, partial [Fidelibacterota bacterium]
MRKYLHFPVLMLIIIWCGFTFASDTSSSNINYQGHETQLIAPLQGMDPTSPEYDMLKTQILKQFEQEERARISAEIEQMKNNYYAAQKEEEIRVKNEYVSRLRAEKAIEKAEWVNQQPSNVVTANANGSLPIETQKEESNIQYDASLYPTPRQGGDTFADASVIGALPFSDAGTTCGYVDDYDAVCPYTGSTSPDVVYEFTTAGGTYDISLCGASDYDTKLYVLDASLTEYACNDDSCPGYVSELIDVTLAAGTYYIIVDGYGGDCGNYTIDVIDTTPVECLDNSLTLYMYDSYGDGWNGNVFNIFDASGNLVDSATLESGDYGTAEFCLPGGDYTVDVDGGSWQSEVSWELYDSAGNLILSGGCPFAGSFTLGGGGGCTDNALTLNMYDS